ncbi:hypothetical protein BT67DRAFT_460015 [Trichocladium antarcticum]|uniref:J domain-containing protein n=1 Tax=Trichocladium antarcticum TaxID=1450529 RepID=A0AAN6URC5_9PEZI|nr:hypothetical protein BT67DRAFT_460015 [Trichocladium antarcticum]
MVPAPPDTKDHDIPAQHEPTPPEHDATDPRPSKFRFKSRSSRSSRHRHGDHDDEGRHSRRHRRHRSRSRSRERDRDSHRHRDPDGNKGDEEDPTSRKHRRQERDDDTNREHRHDRHRRRRHRRHHHTPPPTAPPQPSPPAWDPDPPLSPTTAFRESLFDALADDEGAEYWQSVYGQPVHIYSADATNPATGALERMTDDEYAAHVRRRMWEKTHAGLLEARARRERERAEARGREEAQARIDREMERCLRRGEERRRRRGWSAQWEGYLTRWREWDAGGVGVEGIPWPGGVEGGGGGGGGGEVGVEAVRAFFVHGLGLEEVGKKEFAARLKEERVRWHPDKMQQRLGGKVDDKVMRDVTAIFQVVDALWNDTRKSSA